MKNFTPNFNICIALATYNGESYLKEQLDSIQNQTYKNWKCYIRDDGSTDSTKSIIEEYCHKDSRFIFINPNNSINIGSHKSFYQIVKSIDADFYFFSDQDDIWKKNKIDCYLSHLPEDYTTNPILIYSSWSSVDENVKLIKENDPRTTIHTQVVFNQINGMAMMLNKKLVSIWNYSNIGAHDSYIALLAFATGKVIYIPESTILWRRQTQSESLNNFGRGYGVSAFWNMVNTSFDRAEDIIKNYQELISPEMLNYYLNFIQLRNSRFIYRIKLLFKLKLRRNSIVETIAMNILLLTNLGRIQ